jgi:catechol 2,3-dioxygenase
MATPLPASTHIGAVHLTVSDLDRSLGFYTERLGFRVHGREAGVARLGAGGADLLVLTEDRAARPQRGTTGLYHFAVLVPARADLARSLGLLASTSTPLTGASDHGVSEALYLSDPDDNGIEIYRDRPRAEWPTAGGRLSMGTAPLDLEDLYAAREQEAPGPAGLAPGTVIGHVHLHVADLAAARRFYVDLLGLEIMQRYGPSALFASAGGYHHHVGLNTWHGVGAPPPGPKATGLRWFELVLPDPEDVARLGGRLRAAGVEIEPTDAELLFRDPSRNAVRVRAAVSR